AGIVRCCTKLEWETDIGSLRRFLRRFLRGFRGGASQTCYFHSRWASAARFIARIARCCTKLDRETDIGSMRGFLGGFVWASAAAPANPGTLLPDGRRRSVFLRELSGAAQSWSGKLISVRCGVFCGVFCGASAAARAKPATSIPDGRAPGQKNCKQK